MADKDGIDVTELAHLAIPNWGDVVQRRCIAASLVNVAYLLQTNENQAKQWCHLLQFRVVETIVDDHDKSIFGAVFQWQGTVKAGPGGPPLEVVAFRGTIFRPKTILEDLALDWKVATAHMDSLCRVDKGLQYLQRSIRRNGSQNIWLAGHSLGAAIALVVARKLGREERHNLEAHIFNPPFFSPTFPQLKLFEKIGKILVATCKASPSLHFTQLDKVFKSIQGTSEALAVSMGLKDEKKLLELYGDFLAVSNWTPNIYVSQKDPICCSYIHYFEVWKGIYGKKSHLVHESMKYLFCFEVAKKKTPWHLVPSAKVVIAVGHLFHNHHGICQWWSKDLKIQSIEYNPPDEVSQWNLNVPLTITHWNVSTLQKSAAPNYTLGKMGDDKDGDATNLLKR
ncbi:hypothetical protein SUGI_0205140 [Cryptomeria japonica]|nr:hypothetical protein SUGI_0205140 [Cryptomeria japonica]